MDNKKVDVVLTAYKRPDVLQQQIDAIKNQTYHVNQIFLYQDGINSYYSISFDNKFLKQFSDVCVSNENRGVWERFQYAYRISKSDYVCIFDDDTIPGVRWIENCINCSKKMPGIYGTNGIIVESADLYPDKMTNIGWHNPNKDIIQVDFVGHAWFLRTEWLGWMLEKRNKYDFKYVGEDMALSFACIERGVKTYVPPHPYDDVQMWGSIPAIGMKYGLQHVSVSSNPLNCTAMKNAIVSMKNDGWNFIIENNIEYINSIHSKLETKLHKKEVIEKDLFEQIAIHENVYLYGTGNYGMTFCKYLKYYNVKIAGFIVTNKTKNSIKLDDEQYNIISVKEINKYSNILIILALSEVYHTFVRNEIPSSFVVFPEVEKAYGYNDVLAIVE